MGYSVHVGNCTEILNKLPENSIDAVVTDPPYGLSKEPDAVVMLRHWLDGDDYDHPSNGYMGKSWDSFVPGPNSWKAVYRVLKPGGHVLSFYGARTSDLGTLAIRLAGFEIRNQLGWVYGQGSLKSRNVAKDIDKAQGFEHTGTSDFTPVSEDAKKWYGWGTGLKPAIEYITMARKPLDGTVAENVRKWGVGAINVEGSRYGDSLVTTNRTDGWTMLSQQERPKYKSVVKKGRLPSNLLLSEEAAGCIDAQKEGASAYFYVAKPSKAEKEAGLDGFPIVSPSEMTGGRSPGSAGINNPRAGAGRTSGRRNTHLTVKPIALMEYLVRMVTPPNGVVLDPYAGSGTTGCAAVKLGFSFVGCELSQEYADIARARIDHWSKLGA